MTELRQRTHFRATPPNKRPGPTLLVSILGLHAGLLPWALGGEGHVTHYISLGLGIASLALAFRNGAAEVPKRLMTFPFFWVGVVLGIQIVLQGLNPAFAYRYQGDEWWLERVSAVSWLPSGMTTPFEDMNGWRVMLRYSGPWLSICAAWSGMERRDQAWWLSVCIAANALIFTVYGLLARAEGSAEIYGVFPVDYPYFFGGIVYKNHAAAFLVLAFGATASLALGYLQRRNASEERGSPLIFWVLGCALLAAGVFVTRSAAGCMLLAVTGSVAVYASLKRTTNRRGTARALGAGTLVLLLVGVLAASSLNRFDPRVSENGASGSTLPELKLKSLEMRLLANQAGLEMFLDRPLFGWGAGSFRYGFTQYKDRRPELMRDRQLTLHWEHVHDDWLEFAIEFGTLGLCVVAAGAGVSWWRFRKVRRRLATSSLPSFAACVAVSLYALFDFPFQSPAVAFTFAMVALTVRWTPIEDGLAVKPPPPPQLARSDQSRISAAGESGD